MEHFRKRLNTNLGQMMYVSGETAEASAETTGMIEEIVRQQVIEMVSYPIFLFNAPTHHSWSTIRPRHGLTLHQIHVLERGNTDCTSFVNALIKLLAAVPDPFQPMISSSSSVMMLPRSRAFALSSLGRTFART